MDLLYFCQIRRYIPNFKINFMVYIYGTNIYNTFYHYKIMLIHYQNIFVLSDKVNTNNFYWQNRLIEALADSQFNS